jgi:hypothetical protein
MSVRERGGQSGEARIAVKGRVFRDDHPPRLVSIEVLEDICTANSHLRLSIVEYIFVESGSASEQKLLNIILDESCGTNDYVCWASMGRANLHRVSYNR